MSARLRKVIVFLFLLPLSLTCRAELATIAPLAKQSLLLDMVRHGSLIVAVGERGHILYNDDGQNWHQAMVETRSMLTAVYMLDEKNGWAVGHNAVIVKTNDGARTWQLVHRSSNDEAPLLDVYFHDKQHGMAVGAYGLIFTSDDGGNTWQQQEIVVKNREIFETDLMLPFDLHLNAIAVANETRFYIAAERGYILRTDNAGSDWQVLTTPYHGSFFGALPLTNDDLLLFGLKGHLYRSADAGKSWRRLDTATNAMLTNAIVLDNQEIIITGMAGTLLFSTDAEKFESLALPHRDGFSAVAEKHNLQLILTGEAGIESIDLRQLTGLRSQ